MSVEVVMPSNHLILCCPLLLLPSIAGKTSKKNNSYYEKLAWYNVLIITL